MNNTLKKFKSIKKLILICFNCCKQTFNLFLLLFLRGLCDPLQQGRLKHDQFVLAMHLIYQTVKGEEIPKQMSPDFTIVTTETNNTGFGVFQFYFIVIIINTKIKLSFKVNFFWFRIKEHYNTASYFSQVLEDIDIN